MTTLIRYSRYLTYGCLLIVPILFQNCGKGFETIDLSSTNFLSQMWGAQLQSVGIACQDLSLVTPTDSRRLSRVELINSLKALLGPNLYSQIESSVMSLTNDDVRKDPSTFPASFDSTQLEALDRVSRQVGALVLSNDTFRTNLAGACSSDATITDSCLTNFIKTFGKNAFRRPLTSADVDFFKNIYSTAGSGKAGVSAVVSAALLAPEFLYHVEVGTAGVGGNTQFTLTDYEVASRISYLLTDGPPDSELMSKADSGTLRSQDVLSAQVDRLLNSAAGHDKIHRFIRYWLVLDTFQGFPTAAAYLDGLDTNGLLDEANRELMAFVDYIVYEKKGSYQDLLTSKRSFARSPALASIYGHAVPTSDTQVLQTDANRKGLLLRVPVLANGSNNQTHPILRGVFTLRRILCNDIPSPSPADLAARISANFVPDPLHDTTAQITAKQTSPTNCMVCHSQINPLGFTFEGYDNVGRARTIDKIFDSSGNFIAQHPVSISSTVNLGTGALQVSSAPQLIDGVAGSVVGPACFSRHLYRFFQVRREVPSDGCNLMNTYGALQSVDGSILAAIKASVLNTYTDQRRIQ